MNAKVLRGGCGSNSTAMALEKAGQTLQTRSVDLVRDLKISFGAPTQPVEKCGGAGFDRGELIKYVDDKAQQAFEFLLNIALPWLQKLTEEVEEHGEEVLYDVSEYNNLTNDQVRELYEKQLLAVTNFGPGNDELLEAEAKNDGRKQFVEKLCLRVANMAILAKLLFDIGACQTREQLTDILGESTDAEGNQVFLAKAKGPVCAFARYYELGENAFGRYRDGARDKLASTVASQAGKIARIFKIEQKRAADEAKAKEESMKVSPETLIFGGTQANETVASLKWQYNGHQNAIKLHRVGNKLYLVDAVGMPKFELDKLRAHSAEPFVWVEYFLSQDRQHLCMGKLDENGRTKYSFNNQQGIAKSVFAMACWIRTGLAACMPEERFLPDDNSREQFLLGSNGRKNGQQKPRVQKPKGEMLTAREFLDGGLGEFELPFEAGFHFQARDQEGQPCGEELNLTESATVLVERIISSCEDGNERPKIRVGQISSAELVELFRAGNCLEGRSYFEDGLPLPLRFGKMMFAKKTK